MKQIEEIRNLLTDHDHAMAELTKDWGPKGTFGEFYSRGELAQVIEQQKGAILANFAKCVRKVLAG